MTYPEHEKLTAVVDHSQAIGQFLDWASEQGWYLAEYSDETGLDDLYPVRLGTQQILARYFDIDLDRLETEKREMLDLIRKETS